MTDMTIVPVKFILMPKGEKIFHELATHIEVDDEGGGAFIKIRQIRTDHDPYIRLDPCEIDAFVSALHLATGICDELNKDET